VLEARDRVAGRVWSRRLDNGALVEMGAEFILPDNTVLEETVERLGLTLWEKGMAYGRREPRGAGAVTEADLRAAASAIEAAAGAGGSAAALLERLELRSEVREAVRARVEVSAAAPAEAVGADELRGVAAISDAPSYGVAGGNQALAHALAARLDVHLSSPVTSVRWRMGEVRVGDVTADAVVVAVPAAVIGAIRFDPPLPDELASALSAVRYGHAAKLFVPLSERPPASAVLSVPERYWTWTARAGGGVQPVVNAFAGSPAALERLRVADGPDAWLASLARLRRDLVLEPRGALLSTWDDDPWARAAYSIHPPGGSDPALTARHGPLVLAGEHTAGPYAGLMEGALRSGLRAAAQL